MCAHVEKTQTADWHLKCPRPPATIMYTLFPSTPQKLTILLILELSSHRSTYVVGLTGTNACLQQKCTTLRVISGQS